jgi:hypothetical protein
MGGLMASNFWAKIYIEILDDWKMGSMTDRLWRRTIEIILLAKELDDDGHLPDIRSMAYRLHSSIDELEDELNGLAAVGIVQSLPEGWHVINYGAWQGPMSDVERQSRRRERIRKQEYHEPVTERSQDSHTTVTLRDTEENRIEKNREEKNLDKRDRFFPVHLSSPEMLNAWGEWLEHQKNRTGRELPKGTALKQFKRIGEIGIPRAIVAIEYSIESNYQRLVEPKGQSPDGQQEPAGFAPGREILKEIHNVNS